MYLQKKVYLGCGSKYSFQMAEVHIKWFSAEGAIEVIFNNQDSNDADYDCGCDIEICPDSEM